MNMPAMVINTILSKIRNIISISDFVKRSVKDKESIQIKTSYLRALELKEMFPYGFIAKAKKGKVIVFCSSGNLDSVNILPVCDREHAPEIEEGDVAVYTEGGAKIVLHEDEIYINGGKNGGLIKTEELKKELEKNNQILQAIINVCKTPVTEAGNGAPSAFQTAMNGVISSLQVANYANIENEKVKH